MATIGSESVSCEPAAPVMSGLHRGADAQEEQRRHGDPRHVRRVAGLQQERDAGEHRRAPPTPHAPAGGRKAHDCGGQHADREREPRGTSSSAAIAAGTAIAMPYSASDQSQTIAGAGRWSWAAVIW